MKAVHSHLTKPRRVMAVAGVAAVLLTGCSGSSGSTGASESSAPSQAASASAAATVAPTAMPTEAPTATPTAEDTGVPTALDPCQLVPASEASTLSGASYTSGEASTSGNGKLCTYGANSFNILTVVVGQAPDVATAQSDEQDFVAQLQQAAANGLTLTQLPGFADGADAATLEGSATVGGQSVSVSAIYVLKGTVFFAISDVVINGSAPTSAELQAEAMTVLGRI
jgi:hypothetical protein